MSRPLALAVAALVGAVACAVSVVGLLRPGPSVVSVHEGANLSSDLLDAGLSPRPGRGEVAVQMSSARDRKGYVDHSDQVDYRNASYRGDEMVVVSFIFPRKDLEGPLGTLESLSEEEKG